MGGAARAVSSAGGFTAISSTPVAHAVRALTPEKSEPSGGPYGCLGTVQVDRVSLAGSPPRMRRVRPPATLLQP
jgi:hypothetical protein